MSVRCKGRVQWFHGFSIVQSKSGLVDIGSVNTHDDRVVAFVWFEGNLFLGFEAHLFELLDFGGKHSGRFGRRIDAIGLDRNHKVAAVLEEELGIVAHDTGLIGLGHVCKNNIDGADEHAVFERVPGVFHDGDDVGALLGHVDEIATRAMGKFDGVDDALRTDQVRHVRHRGARCRPQVQYLALGRNKNILQPTQNTGGDF